MTTVLTSDKPVRALTSLPGWRIPPRNPAGCADCCLVVATYQRPGDVRALMLQLAPMADVPAEVVIVDGSPGDETERALREVIRDVPLPFELVYVRSPKGLTRQRNVGVDISTKSYVFFLDDDALPKERYFLEMRRVLAEDTQESMAAVGACIANEINRPMPRRWRIRRAIGLIPRTEPLHYNDVGTSAPSGLVKPFSGVRDVDIFPGGACVIRRSVFGFMRFSDFFDGYSYGEDVEMSLRIRQRWRIGYCGDARVWHNGLESPGGRPKAFTKGRMEVRNRYFIWKRYSSRASLLNKIRFHLDLCFIFAMDLVWFIARPWNTHHLWHAWGLLAGASSCSLSPPRWEEPAPVRRYQLEADKSVAREAPCRQ